MRFFSDPSCDACHETKQVLNDYGISYWPGFVIINVMGAPEYKDRVPMLELDDGILLEGKEAILQWVALING